MEGVEESTITTAQEIILLFNYTILTALGSVDLGSVDLGSVPRQGFL